MTLDAAAIARTRRCRLAMHDIMAPTLQRHGDRLDEPESG
jgi:hypothetical protein